MKIVCNKVVEIVSATSTVIEGFNWGNGWLFILNTSLTYDTGCYYTPLEQYHCMVMRNINPRTSLR